MSSLLIALAIAILVPLTLANPFLGILGWFWISFMNPHQLVWGPASDLPFAAIVAGATLLAWLIGKDPKRIPFNAVTILIGLLGLWITWTTSQAIVPDEAWKIWDRAIKILLMSLVAIALLRTRERLHAAIWILAISLGYFGVKGGVFTLLTGGSARVFGPPSSFIADNNALALALLMTAPFLRYLQLNSAVRWVRWGLLAAMALFIFSAIGSQSRGGFLALAAMAAFLVWKSRYRARMTGVAAVLALSLVWFVPETWVERMETIQTYEEDGSAMARIRTWEWAVDLAAMRPFTGGGFEVYRDRQLYLSMVPEEEATHNFHSIYFEMLGMHGYIGLALFLALVVAVWRTFSHIRKTVADRPDMAWAADLASMAHVSIVAYLVGGAFLNLAFYDLFYFIAAIGVALSRQVASAGVSQYAFDNGSDARNVLSVTPTYRHSRDAGRTEQGMRTVTRR